MLTKEFRVWYSMDEMGSIGSWMALGFRGASFISIFVVLAPRGASFTSIIPADTPY